MADGQRLSVLMTGAGGGLGSATAEVFRAAGWTVYTANLDPPTPGSGLRPLRVDVTSAASVDTMAEEVRADCGGAH